MAEKLNLANSMKLYDEALTLIPGAVLGIRRPYNFVQGEYPIFFNKAKGGRVTDVDGNEYIDFLCAYGPIIIGHREEEIDNAVIQQIQENGFCMSLTQPSQNILAKKLQELIPACEKSVFVKTGSDGTTTAVRIARGYTGKSKVLRCGYHGWHDWCVEVKGGVLPKLYEDTHEFHYNNIEEVRELFKLYGEDVACVIITPIGHPLAHEVEMPNPGFLEELKAITHDHGAVLIFDEIRTGFRITLGGAQKLLGITPDLAVFGKALANGYPIGAVVGKAEIMNVLESKVFLSSTFFPNSLATVAALKTIEIMERDNVLGVIKQKGTDFGRKLDEIIQESGISCRLSGTPWMPFVTFPKEETNRYKQIRSDFYTGLIRRKVFLQPYHHGYICYRHTEEDLQYTLDSIKVTLGELK